MLTPAFELSQDKDFLTVIIRAPFTKITETEIFIEDCDFKFYSKPYFLRLNLPGKLIEDGRETAKYDTDKGTFTIKVPKQIPGEEFEGLDMLTKLLATRGQCSTQQPIIEVLGEKSTLPSEALPDTEIDWSVEQTLFSETDTLLGSHKYGFGCLRSGVFNILQTELCEVVDVKEPDSISMETRTSQRKEQENTKFDDDHYLADLYQDETIKDLLKFIPPWSHTWEQLHKGEKMNDIVIFTEEEKDKMRKLPNKEYLIDSGHLQSVFLSLVDILFAYTYTYRITEGEHNVESGWCVCKLSATFSWLEVFTSLHDVVISCYRRGLCFPLHRHWALLEAAKEDTYKILSLGRRQILKCLLDIQTLLTDTEQRYILNDLYIIDYSVWIQGVSNSKLEGLASALKEINLLKPDVGFSLEELETAAKVSIEEEETGGIVGELEKLAVTSEIVTDSDDESSVSDDDSTNSDDSTDSDDEYSQSCDERQKSSSDVESNKCDRNSDGKQVTGSGRVQLESDQCLESRSDTVCSNIIKTDNSSKSDSETPLTPYNTGTTDASEDSSYSDISSSVGDGMSKIEKLKISSD